MKVLILFGTFLFLNTVVIAQRLNKETLGDFNYIQPPSDKALQEFTTYFVESTVANNEDYREDEVRSACNLEGFEKTMNKDNADFVVKFTVYPTTFTTPTYDKQTHTREKDGVKTTTYTHTYKGYYTHKVTMMIYDQAGTTIYSNEAGSTETLTKSSSTSSDQASREYRDERIRLRGVVTRKNVLELNSDINEIYASMEKKIQMRVIMIKEKKYEYGEFNAAIESLRSACNAIDVDALNASIAAWEADLIESDPASNKARINKNVTAGAHYNIALAYFVLGEYGKSADNFNKATEFDNNVTIVHQVLAKAAADLEVRKNLQ